ncbi:MAG TPA: HNH endonuclease domain-containing protein [Paludibacteraceae bacterium]|nr:HNH endonuclease domain-containing protein [Paludibacteraceae bacterium]
MAKILGLDLGTNSIGWAIRETDIFEREHYYELFQSDKYERFKENPDFKKSNLDNEIVDFGVCHFEKGVGDGKSGEFSLAAERRKNRSKRRLYNAKRYRKWELLKCLIDHDMCPLTSDELKLWSVGNWIEIDGKWKNKGRIYPINNVDFQRWLAFDPAIFGDKGKSDKGNPIRKNPYDLRCELINRKEENEYLRKLKTGRALYHLAQRRGFKSSRKSGQSTYAKNEDIEKLKLENPDFQIALLAKEKLNEGKRFRASGVIQRKYFEDEFYAICEKQEIDQDLVEILHKAIYFVRPLRSQKGLVGNCTLEKGKPRIPISHPKFEEFRALQFINNIKWREKGSKEFVEIPISLKKKILEELFFRKLSSGKNKGKISEDNYFKFEEIIKKYSENGTYEFNYKNLPNVSTCPTIASIMNVFQDEWSDCFIQDENRYGINWDGLSIKYKTQDYKNLGRRLKRKIVKGKIKYIEAELKEEKTLGIDEIWHLLFDYIQTKDNQDALEIFCKEVLGFDENKAKSFAAIDIPQGYGSLSYKAISKILPFLQEGYIYSEAVLFANLKSVLGDKFEDNKEDAKRIIAETIKEVSQKKEILNIVNGLIQNYFSKAEISHAKGVDKCIKDLAWQETNNRLKQYFGVADWNKKSETEKEKLEQKVFELYLRFLNGEQKDDEKASAKGIKVPEIDYYKLPRLDIAIKEKLKAKFNVSDNALKLLYHPSDIEMYPVSKTEIKGTDIKLLESPQPPSKGWKNPMAMRTLHELRHLVNYLLKIGKIDKDTKVVVEMARELNDANKRWAIETYQRYREEENKEFAKAIVGVVKQKYPNINENDIENINRIRLWWEQIDNNEETYRQIKSLKEDVEKYRLWKEQNCVCMYTGKLINITNLFDGTQTQLMHTFPISISFDSSLANLTVGDAFYNNEIQGNKIPTQLPNYKNDITINGRTYTAIEPRLKKWQDKIQHLRDLIDDNKRRTKKTQDVETKNDLIRKRHLLQFDYEYWQKKVDTFTLEEVPLKWKNSQLVDTQIISKYARAYLKTVFEKVDVQKGTITDSFKKIYQIKGEEQKDRSKHSHHAQDAAVLTLIPVSAKRDAILEEYYKSLEKNEKYHIKPYESYVSAHIIEIENNVIINHIPHDKTLTPTIKHIRKRGKKTGKIAQGDSIRGQLHKETFLGAIKVLERNSQGFPVKENGEYKVLKDKTGKDEIWIVSRKSIKDINIDKDIIVDELLKQHIHKQLNNGVELSNVVDFNNKPIRHIRVRYKAGKGFLSKDKTLPLKSHTYNSKRNHKINYLVQNEENYLFLFYEGINEKNQIIRHYRILNLFDIAQLKIRSIHDIRKEPKFKTILKGKISLNLKNILKVGDRVILFKESKDEITEENLKSRLYTIFKFNEPAKNTAYIYLQHQNEARPDNELDNGEKVFNPFKYQPRLELTPDKMNCLFEGIDFEIKPDGTIIFK